MRLVPKVLYCFPQCAGKPFTPSNGTEGDMFMSAFCYRCIHEKWSHTMNDDDKKCDVLNSALLGGKPCEWVFDDEGWPVCTSWRYWDWGNDDRGWNEPPNPEPDSPFQLRLPFIFEEMEYTCKEPEPLIQTA